MKTTPQQKIERLTAHIEVIRFGLPYAISHAQSVLFLNQISRLERQRKKLIMELDEGNLKEI
jgi:hypothetical protein